MVTEEDVVHRDQFQHSEREHTQGLGLRIEGLGFRVSKEDVVHRDQFQHSERKHIHKSTHLGEVGL
jgi:hypothetical protein